MKVITRSIHEICMIYVGIHEIYMHIIYVNSSCQIILALSIRNCQEQFTMSFQVIKFVLVYFISKNVSNLCN